MTGARPQAGAILILLALQPLFTYVPTNPQMFRTAPLEAISWSLIVVPALAPFLAVVAEKRVLRRSGKRSL